MRRKNKHAAIIGEIKGHNISIYEHTGDQYTIFKDSLQQGLIKREYWKQGDGDRYIILYSREFGTELAALIGILVDIIWGTTDISIKSLSYEFTLVLGEEKLDNHWKPKD